MRIVADSAIPFVERFFAKLGELCLLHSSEINAAELRDADVLICRSVTRVNESLLKGSQIRMVVSPTSGVDHIDLSYLQRKQIAFANAPGCNARSVAEYVLSAVCVLSDQHDISLRGKTVGIIGCGHVGSLVKRLFESIGLACQVCDPFLSPDTIFDTVELDEIGECDIITVHTPLTSDGEYPTESMLTNEFFQKLSKDVIFINTSRGEVLNEKALLSFLQQYPSAMAVLDVWDNEPDIDRALLQRVNIATSHIAGYSIDGKFRASREVFQQVCERLQLTQETDVEERVFPDEQKHVIQLDHKQDRLQALQLAILASYDVRSDAAALRRLLEEDEDSESTLFAELRNNYPIRREFSSLQVRLEDPGHSLADDLISLGFSLQ